MDPSLRFLPFGIVELTKKEKSFDMSLPSFAVINGLIPLPFGPKTVSYRFRRYRPKNNKKPENQLPPINRRSFMP